MTQGIDPPQAPRSPSAYATGGGGVVLEHSVAATALAALLLRDPFPGLGDEFAVVRVAFQAGGASPVDDLVITGRGTNGEVRTLAVGVRRDPTIGPSDEKFVSLVKDMLQLLQQRPDELSNGHWRIGLAVAGPHTAANETGKLADIARAFPTRSEFWTDLHAPQRHGAGLRERYRLLAEAVSKAASELGVPSDTDAAAGLTWSLLCALRVVETRLEGDAAPDRTHSISRLGEICDSAHDLWAHLCRLADKYAPAGAEVDETVLRRELRGAVDIDRSPALAQAWRVLDGMKDRLDRRTRRLIAAGGAELTLPRSRTCEDLAAAMSNGNPLIVTGPPDVGKSALTLSALDLLVTNHEAEPTCVSLRDLPATTAEFEHLLGSALVEVLGASSVAKRRVLLIDGGEAVIERRRGLLQDIAAAATDAGLQLVVVTRSDAKTAVDEAIKESVPRAEAASVRLHEVPELADDEVQAVVEAFPILGRIARQPRAKWLIRRLGLVDLVLRSKAVADLDAGGLCEGDVFRAVWFRLVRNREQVTDSGASPDGRAAALVELARRELFPDSEPRPIADVHALASLRSDGLLLPVGEGFAWTSRDSFANDLVRDLGVASLLLSDHSQLRNATAPRWALRAARLACQARLANSLPDCESERDKLQSEYSSLANAYGDRWADVPWEALATLGDPTQPLERAWPSLIANEALELQRLIRVLKQRYAEGGSFLDPETGRGVVSLLLEHHAEVALARGEVTEAVDQLITAWLRGMSRRPGDGPDQARQRVRDTVLEMDRVADEGLTQLALLGPDLDVRAADYLRKLGVEQPHRLGPCVEEIGVPVSLATHQPELLAELTEAYYIEKPRDGLWPGYHSSLMGDGVRGHLPSVLMFPMVAWYKGPFAALLRYAPRDAVLVIQRLLNHAARNRATQVHGNWSEGRWLDLGEQGRKFCAGDSHVWAWYRGSTVGPYPAMSALMAVERFADELVGHGIPLDRIVRLLLKGCESLAMPGLVIGLLVRHLDRVTDELDPWLANPYVWHLEFSRATHEHSGPAHNDPDTPGQDRRTDTFREVAGRLVAKALRGGDRKALARLTAVAERLVSRAQEVLPEDDVTTVRAWATSLRIEDYQPAEIDGVHGLQAVPPADVAAKLATANAELERGQKAWTLLQVHTMGSDVPAPDRVRADLKLAMALGSERVQHGPPDAMAPIAGVACSALASHECGKLVLDSAETAWATDLLVRAALTTGSHPFDIYSSRHSSGPDRSAARGLPLALLAAFDKEHLWARDEVHEGLAALLSSPINEVRRYTVRTLDAAWTAPCTGDGIPCRHAIALALVLQGARFVRLSPWDGSGERHSEAIDLPFQQTLPAVPTEDLWIHQLPAAIHATAACAGSGCCVADQARQEMAALLDAYHRGFAHWCEKGYDVPDEDRALIAAVLLATGGSGDQLRTSLSTWMVAPEALCKVLADMTVSATYDLARRTELRTVWPSVMELVLDAIEAGRLDDATRGRGEDPLAAIMPAPRMTISDGEPDETIRKAATGWPTIGDLRDHIERWLRLQPRSGAAIDALVGFVRTSSDEDQVRIGLNLVGRLVGDEWPQIHDPCFLLVEWLKELRSGPVAFDDKERRTYQRLVDALASAGFSQAVRLQELEE